MMAKDHWPFGHSDLKSSDFGWWTCHACGNHGDDWTHPKDFACITEAEEAIVTEELTDREMDQLETEEEFLSRYDLKKYPAQALAADLCIFTIHNNQLSLLLIERGGHPEKGKWALPGGFVNINENVDEAAARELEEETGIAVEEGYLEQLRTYAYPGRDPRGFIASVAYVAFIPKMATPTAGDDAAQARFWAVDDILSGEVQLAFNHREIVEDGLERVRAKLEYAPLAPLFLEDDEFTISELRRVYELVWGKRLNASNFRRKVQSVEGFLIAVDGKRVSKLEGGRTADLYRAGDIPMIYPPLRQPSNDEE